MENTNPDLLRIAKRRASYKAHLIIYILANLLIWLIYILLMYSLSVTFPWALFPTIGWGIGLAFHYFFVFRWNDKMVEKELQKLRKEAEIQDNNPENV